MRHKTLVVMVLLAAGGSAAPVSFLQSGWSGSGPLSVSFTGLDSNVDGALAVDELTHFRATWRTPGGWLTEWGLPEIEPEGFFFIDLENLAFFVGNTEYSLVDTAFGGEFLATVFDSALFPVDSTSGATGSVPEPGSIGLIGALSVASLIGRISTQSKVPTDATTKCRLPPSTSVASRGVVSVSYGSGSRSASARLNSKHRFY